MILCVLLFSVLFFHVKAQDDHDPNQHPSRKSLQANLGITIGIFSTIFSVSFLLLVYAKLGHSALFHISEEGETEEEEIPDGFRRSSSGLERCVIESLPFFTFSSLKGSKQGLECAVCLSKFKDSEVLRLLPQCRCKFDSGDLKNLSLNNSFRFPGIRNSSSVDLSVEPPLLELFVEREQRFQKFGFGFKFWHKVKHRITFSDLIYKSRWSDANSSDLMFLNSQMIKSGDGRRRLSDKEFVIDEGVFKIKEDLERKRLCDSKVTDFPGNCSVSASTSATSKLLVESAEKRSMSEIINVPRNRTDSSTLTLSRSGRKDEIIRKLWLPIATRTVQWFASREKGLDWKRCPWNV